MQSLRLPRRARTRAAAVILMSLSVIALVPGTSSAYPYGRNTTVCSQLSTICTNIAATDGTNCAFNEIAGFDTWQCTPVLVASYTPIQQPSIAGVGGNALFAGDATCQYRERNGGWGSWQDCPGGYTKRNSTGSTWSSGQATQGGRAIVLSWDPIFNYDSWGQTDCIEVRVSVKSTLHYARSWTDVAPPVTGHVEVERVAGEIRMPSSGTNVDGICEGGWPY